MLSAIGCGEAVASLQSAAVMFRCTGIMNPMIKRQQLEHNDGGSHGDRHSIKIDRSKNTISGARIVKLLLIYEFYRLVNRTRSPQE